MKKLFMALVGLLIASNVMAQEISIVDSLKKIPAIKQGIAFSTVDSKFNYLATFDVAKFKGFNLEVGYAGEAKETANKLVAVVSYDLLKLKNVIDLPILNLIELRPGVYAGYGRIEGADRGKIAGEADFGVSLSVISLKF